MSATMLELFHWEPNGFYLKPLVALRDSGQVKLSDFSALVATWRQEFGARACTFRLSAISQ